ncbi:MAG: hypothetical protein IJG30_06715, partial [Synergistaceae bacterium]|nr:hypothetical protein [Synergistaceae bacterium]
MKRSLCWLVVAMMLFCVIASGGCGGSSTSDSDSHEAYYEPPKLTEEQLLELGQAQVDPSEFNLPELNASEVAVSDAASENALARKVWTEAVKLFTEGARYTRVTEHPQPDGTNILIRQSRYVYVYRYVQPEYEIDDESLSTPAVQHKDRDTACQHGMYGTDCVGMIWNAANNAGVTLWGAKSKSRVGPLGLATKSTWQSYFPNA